MPLPPVATMFVPGSASTDEMVAVVRRSVSRKLAVPAEPMPPASVTVPPVMLGAASVLNGAALMMRAGAERQVDAAAQRDGRRVAVQQQGVDGLAARQGQRAADLHVVGRRGRRQIGAGRGVVDARCRSSVS